MSQSCAASPHHVISGAFLDEALRDRFVCGLHNDGTRRKLLTTNVPSAKRVPVVISVIGTQTYAVLYTSSRPDLQRSKSLEGLIQLLKEHYEPKPLVIAERYFEIRRPQKLSPNMSQSCAASPHHVISGAFLDEALRDRFVCGLHNDGTRRKLLTEPLTREPLNWPSPSSKPTKIQNPSRPVSEMLTASRNYLLRPCTNLDVGDNLHTVHSRFRRKHVTVAAGATTMLDSADLSMPHAIHAARRVTSPQPAVQGREDARTIHRINIKYETRIPRATIMSTSCTSAPRLRNR